MADDKPDTGAAPPPAAKRFRLAWPHDELRVDDRVITRDGTFAVEDDGTPGKEASLTADQAKRARRTAFSARARLEEAK